MPISNNPRYYPSLDGLRAISIIAVLLFHANSIWLEGGFLGVEAFFAISGFIITTLLQDHWQKTSRLDLLRFWQRRCRRLLPGIITTVLATAGAVAVFYPEEFGQVREDLLPGLSFTSNWFYILSERSYFELAGRPRLLEHLWSLAVEFQYYLIWPLLCLPLFRFGKAAGFWACLGGAIAAGSWMAFLYQPGDDPSRIYFGTDTRIGGLLIGSAAAFALPDNIKRLSPAKACLFDAIAVLALAGLFMLFIFLDEAHPFLYRGGFACTALLTTLCIMAPIIHGQGMAAAMLGWKPMRIIGTRAYNIYLWHWPVFCLSQPWVDVPLDGIALFTLRLFIIAALTEVSYRFIDTPIRAGWLKKTYLELRQSTGLRRRTIAAAGLSSSGIFAAGFAALLSANQTDLSNSIATEQAQLLGIGSELDTPEETLLPAAIATAIPDQPQETAMGIEETSDTDIDEPPGANRLALSPMPNPLLAGACSNDDAPPLPLNALPAPPQRRGGPWPTIDSWPDYATAVLAATHPPNETAELGLWNHGGNPFYGQHVAAHAQSLLSMAAEHHSDADGEEMPGSCRFSTPGEHPVNIKVKTRHTEKGSYVFRVYPAEEGKREVFALGDSVMLGAANLLSNAIGDIDVDAQVGRQLAAGTALLSERKRKDLLGNTVIVHLGNNGPISARQLTEMLDILKETQWVILVNLKVPRAYEAASNALLSEISAKYPNVTLADWHSPSLTAPKAFVHDGLHLTNEGVRLYAKLISQTLCKGRS